MKIWLYKIINLKNNKLYIGLSTKGNDRWNDHCYNVEHGHDSLLCNAIRKHNKHSFKFILLYAVYSRRIASNCERGLIQKYQSNNLKYGYNQTSGGDFGLGVKWSKTSRNKMRGNKNASGKRSWKSRIRIGNKLRGRKFSEKAKRNIAESVRRRHKNKVFTKKWYKSMWPIWKNLKRLRDEAKRRRQQIANKRR